MMPNKASSEILGMQIVASNYECKQKMYLVILAVDKTKGENMSMRMTSSTSGSLEVQECGSWQFVMT